MADLGTPAAGSATPNPAAGGGGGGTAKQAMIYICGGNLLYYTADSVTVRHNVTSDSAMCSPGPAPICGNVVPCPH